MHGNVLVDVTNIPQFFQIAIHFLVGQNREQNILIGNLRIIFILFQYFSGFWQNWNPASVVCFRPVDNYPFFSVSTTLEMNSDQLRLLWGRFLYLFKYLFKT